MVMFCMARDGGGWVMARRGRAGRAKVRRAWVRACATKASGFRARVNMAWAIEDRFRMVRASGVRVGSPGPGFIKSCAAGSNVFLVAGHEHEFEAQMLQSIQQPLKSSIP